MPRERVQPEWKKDLDHFLDVEYPKESALVDVTLSAAIILFIVAVTLSMYDPLMRFSIQFFYHS